MNAEIVKIEANVPWRAFRDEASGRWIAICDALALTAEAESWGQLSEAVSEMLSFLVDDLLRTGELEAFLRDQGWALHSTSRLPEPTADVTFDVPFALLQQPTPARAGCY